MNLGRGTQLGPYEIVESIGAGGMGEVWRAKDTRLDREVAIKILPRGLAGNYALLQRFEREAKAISSLNHPHICTLHDVGKEEGAGDDTTHYLVMELIEGESLGERLKNGPLPIQQVLEYGRQIASALDAAHRQGIVHRDLKPDNVMLTRSGAKLLDFGLAKAAEGGPAPIDGLTSLPTQLKPLTQEGTILGTFQYMAPEQLEGLDADARTDIFALGALLYEMATGQRAFQGSSKTILIASIVSAQPQPISAVAETTPPALDHVVRRCLEKDPDDRWQSAHDVASQLQWISEAGSQAGVAATVTVRRKTREKLAWTLAAVAAVAAIALGALNLLRPRPEIRTIQAEILPLEETTFTLSGEAAGTATISPDGRYVTFQARDADGKLLLWLRPLDSRRARPIPGTENARYPFWSHDSRFIAFFNAQSLVKVDIQGGPPLALATIGVNPRRGSWNKDDLILFSPSSLESIHSIPATGGTPTPVTTLDAERGETTHRWASFLPDGRHFLYMAGTHTAGTRSEINAIYASDLDNPGESKLLVRARSNAEYADGHLLYVRDSVLVAHPFDLDKLELYGNPVPVAEGVQYSPGFFHGAFAAAGNGTLMYRIAEESEETRIERLDASGAVVALVQGARPYQGGDLSPDGRRLAISIVDQQVGTGDIWIIDLERDVSTRFTFDPADEQAAHWSPDGSRIVFARMHQGKYCLFEKPASGEGEETLIVANDLHLFPSHWAADGEHVAVISYDPQANLSADLRTLIVESGEIAPLLVSDFDETSAVFSPDGHWFAYSSNESGRNELYVAPFPGPGGKWQISSEGVVPETVFWGADGSTLYYGTEEGTKKVVELRARGSALEIGAPQTLYQDPSVISWLPEPRRDTFLAFRAEEQSLEAPITIVTNWTVPLKGD
jgi:Tol biopolymer transport system component